MIAIVSLALILFALLSWYKLEYSMDFVMSKEINTPNAPVHILIATQGSEFKNRVTETLIAQLNHDSIYVMVIDVSRLDSIQEGEWNVIVLMHTWENWEPQPDAEQFVNRVVDKRKLIVLTTSGAGDNQMDGIDGIASASKLDTSDQTTGQIITRIKEILKYH